MSRQPLAGLPAGRRAKYASRAVQRAEAAFPESQAPLAVAVYVRESGLTDEPRLVDPLGLVDKDDVWYLLAGTEKGQRTFRVDRIADAVVTDLAADRPADFELSAAWERVVDKVERKRSLVSATVLPDARFLSVLRSQFGRHCELADRLDDGRVRVRLAGPTALTIAEHLAGWGALVEVVEPESVQAELARIGSELTQRYAG